MAGFQAEPFPVAPCVVPRSSIGGNAILPPELEVPNCRNCGTKLLLFLQFDIDKAWSLPLRAGSHLVVFMCAKCNEIPCFDEVPNGQLPTQFWNITNGHFFAAMTKPDVMGSAQPADPFLVLKELRFVQMDKEGHTSDTIRVGGHPFWLQYPERFICCCGSEMAFVSQIAENFRFEKQTDAPEQPDSFSANDYCLFLGNEIYIFACPNQCDPRSVWITVQG